MVKILSELIRDRESIRVRIDRVELAGELTVPWNPQGLVIVAHGTDGKPYRWQDDCLRRLLAGERLAALSLRLVSDEEAALDNVAHHLRYRVDLLARRLCGITDWLVRRAVPGSEAVGYLGTGTAAAAALTAAARRESVVRAVVSRDGRPDLAAGSLARLRTPLLFVVDESDVRLMDIHRDVLRRFPQGAETVTVPGAARGNRRAAARESACLFAEWFLRNMVYRVRAENLLRQTADEQTLDAVGT